MKLKKLFSLLIVTALMLTLVTACLEDNDDDKTPGDGTGTAEGNDGTDAPDRGDYRDLGGRDISIGIWWNESTTGTSAYAEARADYLLDIQEKHNFTIGYSRVGSWGQMVDLAAVSVIAGDPEATIFTFDSQHIMALFRQNLLYPVSNSPSIDFTEDKWNQHVRELMTFNGITYGFSNTYEPREGLFFNKDVLMNANIDYNIIYDMQENNTWTWEAFLELCEIVTQDLTNDGETDIWAITAFNKATLNAAIISNGAAYVTRDSEGVFHNATMTNEFLEAVQFVRELNTRGFVRPSPFDDGGDWQWFIDGFNEGTSAFRIHDEYAKRSINEGGDFEWGFVFFPRGPRADELISVYRENVRMIPVSVFSDAEVDDIMFAYDLYIDEPPGFGSGQGWRSAALDDYRDRRAIDETLYRMRLGIHGSLGYHAYISNFETGRIADTIWYDEKTPVQLIEEAQQEWNHLISEANALFAAFG